MLDLHDSRRSSGESAQYQSEDRPGLGDGRYFAIAEEVLLILQEQGTRSGEEYSSLASIQQAVQDQIEWATDLDIEYVLNVLSRPTELKLLHSEDGAPAHIIGDKETNLVEKAAHIVEYRLSRVGKTALAIASDNLDITYIEGDVTKLIRAIEAGRLTSALGFVERLLQQMRTEHLSLIALIEQASGGRRSRTDAVSDLELHRQTMSRAVDLVEVARGKVDEIIRREIPLTDDVPIGLIKAKVKELSGGIVRYGRELTHLAELSMRSTSSSVQAPSFMDLAKKWVKTQPTNSQLNIVLAVLGPAFVVGVIPIGTDFAGIIKARSAKIAALQNVELEGFTAPIEDQFLEWLLINQSALDQQLNNGRLNILDALKQGLGELNGEAALNCLVTALTTPDEWVNTHVEGKFGPELGRSQVPGLDVMFSTLELKKRADSPEDQT
ncbi:hypothetical protein CAter282_4366 [Collimonas arenae]|uniref:Uncharacterized protein n=1 Tax=Collimonas arenae TaxID=279058 RepID=A0A127QPR0_9BURK|nr:hypothetical protein CAter282_4366 [Collimonas arenae]